MYGSAGQFIVDTVITFILEGIKTFVTTAFTAIALMLEQLFPSIDVISTNPLQISVGGTPLDFSMSVVSRDLSITFGDMVFDLQNVLEMQVETLGIEDDFNLLFFATAIPAAAGEAIFLSIIRLLLSATKGMPPQAITVSHGIALGTFLANTVIQYLFWINRMVMNRMRTSRNFRWYITCFLG